MFTKNKLPFEGVMRIELYTVFVSLLGVDESGTGSLGWAGEVTAFKETE